MNEVRAQAWVARVESAFAELDPKRLIERIDMAEAAIDARLFDLRNDSDHHEERELITDAQRTLRSLRRNDSNSLLLIEECPETLKAPPPFDSATRKLNMEKCDHLSGREQANCATVGELEQKVEERTQQLAQTVARLESEVQVRRKTEAHLRKLSARLLCLQDEERRRVARDLHDSTGQTLTALKLTLASLETLVASIPNTSQLLSDLNALADQALQEIRTTSHLLHPPLLDEIGFSSAAQWYVDGLTKRSGIKASLEVSAPPLTKLGELVLFRVLQESLTNALRHSGSKSVDIRLHSDDETAFLSIRDYGRGLPSEKLKSFHETGAGVGVGLAGMKQRVAELGGQLIIESDGRGTCVTATVPLAKADKSAGNHDRGVGQAQAA